MKSVDESGVNDERWVLPMKLRQGIREALDAGRGRRRMDPQDLAELIGKAIDMELDRLARIRAEREHKRRLRGLFRQAEMFVAPNGHRGISKVLEL